MINLVRPLPPSPKGADDLSALCQLIANPKQLSEAIAEFISRRDEISLLHAEANNAIREANQNMAAVDARESALDDREEALGVREEAMAQKETNWAGKCSKTDTEQKAEAQRLTNMNEQLIKIRDDLAADRNALMVQIKAIAEREAALAGKEAVAAKAMAEAEEIKNRARALVG